MTQTSTLPENPVTWEAAREHFRYQAGADFDAACEFTFASPMAPIHPDFASYARASFTPDTRLLLCALGGGRT